ncbi:MAG: YfcC family protein [Pedobacter sp.]|nr:MAG: YfcC family protein [Pedobacter sp.]
MPSLKSLPSPLSILMLVIVFAALATWLIPSGKYNTLAYTEGESGFTYTTKSGVQSLPFTQKTLDSLKILITIDKFKEGNIRKPVSVPGTFYNLPKNRQGIIEILTAPVKGIYDTIDIILFILFTGGFINVFYATGAMEAGLKNLSTRMNGREAWLIIILGFLFSFGGASYGMAEEAFAFYPIMVPLFLAAGYDLIVPVAVLFGGTQLGTLSSFSNPFSTIIASNAAGINWADGLTARLVMFVITTGVFIWYVVRYAEKVKRNPQASLVYKYDGLVSSPFPTLGNTDTSEKGNGVRNNILLLLFLCTFLMLIVGVVVLKWWLPEMSVLFLSAAILVAVITRMGEKAFISKFITGAEGLLGVAFLIGTARGVTMVLNDGNISDSILYYASNMVDTLPPSIFIVLMLFIYMLFTVFISSSSGMAVVTMPIMGSLAMMTGVPGREVVNSYLDGMGIMGFITPTGLILPSLALVNVSLKAWWRFIWPLMLILILICILSLVIGIRL